MKKHLAILLIFSLLSPYFVSAQTDPCQDKEFLRLKDVSINDMSDREYKYFMMMSERCTGDAEKVQTATLQYPEFDSSEKRAEFNRKRLTIKTKTTSSASGSAVELFDTGIFVGGARVSDNAEWIPYRGFSTISVVDFLEVSGNEREAEAVRKMATDISFMEGYSSADSSFRNLFWAMVNFGMSASLAGILVETGVFGVKLMNNEWFGNFLMWRGMSIWCLGLAGIYLYPFPEEGDQNYKAHTQAQTLTEVGYTNIFPITQAVQMADGYNRQLWREITNR